MAFLIIGKILLLLEVSVEKNGNPHDFGLQGTTNGISRTKTSFHNRN